MMQFNVNIIDADAEPASVTSVKPDPFMKEVAMLKNANLAELTVILSHGHYNLVVDFDHPLVVEGNIEQRIKHTESKGIKDNN